MDPKSVSNTRPLHEAQKDDCPPRSQTRLRAIATRVRFLENRQGVLSVLEVETPPIRSVMPRVVNALHRLGVHIVHAHIRTSDGAVTGRLEVVEPDGNLVSPQRRLEIQTAILGFVGVILSQDHGSELERAVA